MSIAQKQQEILEELSFFPDWQERYEYVIGLGRKLSPMADGLKSADLSFIDQTGLKEHLAPTRANALNLMATQMKQRALEFSAA
jgi:sulfur transfer protein SufE